MNIDWKSFFSNGEWGLSSLPDGTTLVYRDTLAFTLEGRVFSIHERMVIAYYGQYHETIGLVAQKLEELLKAEVENITRGDNAIH